MPLVVQLPFGISVDLSFWQTLFSWPNWEIIRAIFAIGGWVVLALIFFYVGSEMWKGYRSSITGQANWKWILLAVDIPEELVQSPKAVEQIFAHLSGAHDDPSVEDQYWKGEGQKYFSLEIISLEGYIQFLIRTEDSFRDLVEAAVYAHYPAAEITEVEDYVDKIKDKFPDKTQDIFGIDFGLAKEDSYPIRTYFEFEHNISKDSVFTDPMASILENFSRVGIGEYLFMQIIIKPIGSSWKEKGIDLCKKIIAQEEDKKPEGFKIGPKVGYVSNKVFDEAHNILNWNFEPKEDTTKVEKEKGLSDLTPGSKATLEAVEEKISKIGFKTKIRLLYGADKRVFNPQKTVHGFIGSLKQFFNSRRNGFEVKFATKKKWPFKDSKLAKVKTSFVDAFKNRVIDYGANDYILNTEELATIWHFPLSFVKTPLIQKISSRRAEPPTDLSIGELDQLPFEDEDEDSKPTEREFITDAHGLLTSDFTTDGEGEIKTDTDKEPLSRDIDFG